MDEEAGEQSPLDGVATGVLQRFGKQLKACRTLRGMSREELGRLTGYSGSTIAAFEQGKRIPPPKFIDRADEVLGVCGVLKASKEDLERAQYPAFFQDAAGLEAKAIELHVYATQGMPGLLQTPEHAREVFANWRPLLDEDTVAQRVAARLARQEIFLRKPMPTISFVIEEAAVRRPLGGSEVWHGQLEQLLLRGQHRNVEIQIMPTSRMVHAGLAGPFTLMEMTDGRRIAYTEVQGDSRVHTARQKVRGLEAAYGTLRAQACTPAESMALVEQILGEK
ncbi:helix-turn-helix transcriptional regulator [Streptomyces sp. NA04227]|uniref:helix-turn-helix domain-containing protein n=1 Tax=Streptomyces sp. NA04227 TaxID=2742136 RepID=UPI001591C2D8|nr:helix-turn-helix transcriptional regulator [Streptomyces sp. NA04227]QKW09956.1 helix-turn-helix transcriptional regulator [Streptomyces sp. NA04227]